MKKTEKMVKWALKTALNDKYGYSQLHREGKPDYDCSSFVSDALRNGGFQIDGFPTTRELYSVLIKLGWHVVNPNEQNGLIILPGDIMLNPGKHVVIVSGEGKIVHARSDENGGIRGDKPGDQTRHEIEESVYYTPAGGWQYHMRYDETPVYAILTDFQYEVVTLLLMAGIWTEVELKQNNINLDRVLEEKKFYAVSSLVIAGEYGNNPDRKEKLESQGFSYEKVQKYVNRRLGKLPW